MTDPREIDYATALQKAVYDRLRTVPAVGTFQHVPAKTAPPVYLIRPPVGEPRGGKGSVAHRWTVVVMVVTKGEASSPNFALQAKARGKLEQWQPAPTADVIFGTLYEIDVQTDLILSDDLYYGTLTFQATTEPA